MKEANIKSKKLRDALHGSQEMSEKIAELSAWLQKYESEIPEHGSITNASDLISKNKKFQVLNFCDYVLRICQ